MREQRVQIKQAMLTTPDDIAAQADSIEGVRQGLEDASKGNSRPAREFFSEFEAKHDLAVEPRP
jgi:hypothetical protein